MNKSPPKHIICAVRGQPYSRQTATRAISLALEHEARLTFFLVIDAEFLGASAPTMTPLRAVYRQLEEMGEFALLILCDRAERRGVAQVDYLIRRGNVPQQLHQLAIETNAEMMVIGRPMPKQGKSIFLPEQFDAFVSELEKDGDLRVIQVIHEENDPKIKVQARS